LHDRRLAPTKAATGERAGIGRRALLAAGAAALAATFGRTRRMILAAWLLLAAAPAEAAPALPSAEEAARLVAACGFPAPDPGAEDSRERGSSNLAAPRALKGLEENRP
jgi:hypothetical protein